MAAMCDRSRLTTSPPLRPAARASSAVNSWARPWACAAFPPLLAISRCLSRSIDANPRLLFGRSDALWGRSELLFVVIVRLLLSYCHSGAHCGRAFRARTSPGAAHACSARAFAHTAAYPRKTCAGCRAEPSRHVAECHDRGVQGARYQG